MRKSAQFTVAGKEAAGFSARGGPGRKCAAAAARAMGVSAYYILLAIATSERTNDYDEVLKSRMDPGAMAITPRQNRFK